MTSATTPTSTGDQDGGVIGPMGGDTSADDESSGQGETRAPQPYTLGDAPGPLDRAELELLDAWWRAANYLSVGQIYLLDNPLLRVPLTPQHIKPRLLGHWGTTPALNLVYAHANRVIRARDLDAVYVMGPGHGGPGPNACAWLEGTYSEVYSGIGQDAEGLRRFFRQFSFPGGVPSHVAPDTPGSFHEGGELGYSLLHAFGAAYDNPDLVVFCVVGDGEAETGPLAASWHANKLMSAARDGAVIPVLNLNEYKIANPTLLARIGAEELTSLLRGYGYEPQVVGEPGASADPAALHQEMAAALDACLDTIAAIQARAREQGDTERPAWPMIVLQTPKGWTGPVTVDGQQVEGTFRAHQVPLPNVRSNAEHLAALEAWLRAYRPEELFDADGRPVAALLDLPPTGTRRMSANPHSNGGELLHDLDLPDFRDYAVDVSAPGTASHEPTRVLGGWLRDVVVRNPDSFLLFGPDEVASNRLQDVFDATDRVWAAQIGPHDQQLAVEGRVVEVLSEHLCQGLLEGYLLSGRHGVFTCYEAFIHIVDSMFNQHAKWLEATAAIPWRRPLASLNYLLSSHVWRQDHNGFTHQDPGFLDVVLNKKPEIVRVYLPPDANTLLSTYDHCLRSRHYVNVVVVGKQPALDYLHMDAAVLHCTRGIGIWDWAGDGVLPHRRARCGPRLRGRHPHAGDARRRRPAAPPPAGAEGPGRQRGRPDASAARDRAPARPARPPVRRAVHQRPPGRVRLSWLSVARPPAHLPAHEPSQPSCEGIPRGGDDHHPVRHGHAERPRPLPPRHGRDRPRAWPRAARRRRAPGHAGRPHPRPQPHPRARRGPPRRHRLDLAAGLAGCWRPGGRVRHPGGGWAC